MAGELRRQLIQPLLPSLKRVFKLALDTKGSAIDVNTARLILEVARDLAVKERQTVSAALLKKLVAEARRADDAEPGGDDFFRGLTQEANDANRNGRAPAAAGASAGSADDLGAQS